MRNKIIDIWVKKIIVISLISAPITFIGCGNNKLSNNTVNQITEQTHSETVSIPETKSTEEETEIISESASAPDNFQDEITIEDEQNEDNNTYETDTYDISDEPTSYIDTVLADCTYTQMIIVESYGTRATVTMHEYCDGSWNEIMRTNGYVGSQGVGQANSVDSITPRGTFSLTFPFGIKDNPGTQFPYLKVDEYDYWLGCSEQPGYNTYYRSTTSFPGIEDAEHLIDYTTAYAYCLFIGYNLSGTPYAGSCFFLHCEEGIPTAGCVSIPENDMIFVLQHYNGNCGININ